MKLSNNSSNLSKFEINLEQARPSQDILSIEVRNIIQMVNYVIICALIALFGIIANAINMTVFYRQGFNTTTNISFFALAISDMLGLVTMQWFAICLNPYLETSNIQFVPQDVQHLSGGWLHVCSGRITSWITVFITAERCLGVTFPLKVRQIITLRRTTIAICTIFIVNLSMLLPEYCIAYWDWKFVPARNRSLFGLVYRSYKDQAYGLTYILNSASGMMSLVCLILFTTFLVTKLSRKSKWRSKVATGGSDNSETVSSRDKKTMKMITMIAIVLIVCYIPGTVLALVSSFVPEFMIGKAFNNSYYSFWSISFIFDTINSSVNVFLYYRMSTKYRQTFNELFALCITTDVRSPAVSSNK